MQRATLKQALEALGAILEDRGVEYELFAIGGGSLLLTGYIERPTEDLDIVALAEDFKLVSAKPLPNDLVAAVSEVADLYGLAENWLNAGPTDLLTLGLPAGFKGRTTTDRFGTLTVHHAGRFDQICFKLYAAADNGPRSKHANDLKRLQPSRDEMMEAARWTRTHDPGEAFGSQLRQVLAWMGVKDAVV